MMKENYPYTAGEFRSPIAIERPTSVPDGVGGQEVTWNPYLPVVWCFMENRMSKEDYGDSSTGRVRSFNKVNFVTWWRDDILVTDRIFYLGVYYNIRGVNNLLFRNKFLQMVAESGVEL